MTATVIQKDQAKIDNQISDYLTAIDKVNTLLKAFTDAGYTIEDKQANQFCQRNFNDDSLRAYALTISSTTSPTQQEAEIRAITTDLKGIIVKAIAGWNLIFHSMADVRVKNLKAVEDPKVIKDIEERYSVYAEGVQLDVFSQLEAIAEQINVVFPQLKQSVFNRRLDFRHLFREDAEGKVIPNLDFIDFSDL
ncbi:MULTISPECIES: hypothetical protein [unclassified Kaistella]|uniref:hypothetical protein n=1 Tax=unclassified Kaistella TaxID=2762626 RepID=UPI002734B64F|nr:MULTISPECIES: hypothetical protein [unclassified Kaistella]MDP2452645.1 hypothetical protein [Kaistella sp. SH11-4b]MDP2455554.1 hypothetical protein [Kaistella sp. SH40-3]MDP2458458.1 hypothetical protein [Kaistella sp. SH19-2b]